MKKKYDIIENSFGIKSPIRINDFKAIEAAILENKDYNELDALAILADKNYPKSMLGDYELAIMFENKGDNPRAVRYYMSGFGKEEIADLTKDMMFAKAEELKKTFAKKPKIKGKVGQDNTIETPVEETPADTPATETPSCRRKKTIIMAKVKTTFFCQNCGAQYAKWQGQCNSCKEWNTIAEEIIQKQEKAAWKSESSTTSKAPKPLRINEIDSAEEIRLNTTDNELNRVLGGGIVPGSLILLGGEPGIGKSTLLLQISLKLPYKTLYVSGEESQKQIKMRAERITPNGDNCYILTETKTQNIFKQIEAIQPEIVIIDSIQTLHTDYIESTAGSISQIRETTAELIKFAKETNIPVILIGHITKDGTIAGPKILEHMVDTVLQFEGDRNHVYRILRSLKNRFGSTAEIGIYEMLGSGLREVSNPSEILISHKDEELSGTAIAINS